MSVGSETGPRWDLSNIYPSFESSEYRNDLERMERASIELLHLLENGLPADETLSSRLLEATQLLEEAGDLGENLGAWAHAVYSCDTSNARALECINELEEKTLPLQKGAVIYSSCLAQRQKEIEGILESPRSQADEELARCAFFLREEILLSKHRMPVELEDLANDLGRSGIEAWSRLQEAVSSKLAVPFGGNDPEGGKDSSTQTKTVIELRNLAFSPDRSLRKAAFEAELGAWESMEIPLAAALNGVKGATISLDERRAWDDPVSKSAVQSRLSPKALEALIQALEESLPVFRRYLKAKARDLGVDSCAFYDLFAPVGKSTKTWSWESAKELISRVCELFDQEMGRFVQKAFRENWLDAEVRQGKVGGAYCTSFPVQGDSRILCNWENSFSSVSTVAHELGHAWHHELIRHKPRSLRSYPMILAETASIFTETLLFETVYKDAPEGERHSLLEGNLQDSCQVIVDILSRFRFEREVFQKRRNKELSPQELCSIMREAQLSCYGDGLDQEALHPYMWAVKVHYYIPSISFYNYPYAFGQLFALALYAQFAQAPSELDKADCVARYRRLLANSGSADAVELARDAGVDLEDPAFWRAGIDVIARRVREYERITEERP